MSSWTISSGPAPSGARRAVSRYTRSMPAISRDGRYKRFSCLRGNDGRLSADRARGILNIRLSDAYLRGAFLNVSTFLQVRPFVAHDSHACGFADYGDQRSGCGRVFCRRTRQSEVELPASYVPTEASFIFALYAAARTIPLAVIALVASTNVRNQQYCYWAPWQVSYSRWMRGLGCCNVTWENQLDLLSLLHSSFLLVCLLRGSVRGSVE
jgi:hypothetical protein